MIELVGRDGVVGDVVVEQQGLVVAPAQVGVWADGRYVTASTGNVQRDRSHIIAFDPRVCRSTAMQVGEPVVREVAAAGESVWTINTVNNEGFVHRHVWGRGEQAVARFSSEGATGLVVHRDSVLLVTEVLSGDSGGPGSSRVLRSLDAGSLVERWKIDLPMGEVGGNMVVIGSDLYIPESVGRDDRVGDRLVKVNLETRAVSDVPLGEPLPYILLAQGSDLYVGHTFLNPTFRNEHDYKTITKVSTSSGKAERFRVGIEIEQLAIDRDVIWVYGGSTDEHTWLNSYRLSDMSKLSELRIDRPRRLGYMYPAGFFLLPHYS